MKNLTVELIPDSEEGGDTARVPDIPAYGEGETEEEAIADLKIALWAYIEEFGLEDARARINALSTLRTLEIQIRIGLKFQHHAGAARRCCLISAIR